MLSTVSTAVICAVGYTFAGIALTVAGGNRCGCLCLGLQKPACNKLPHLAALNGLPYGIKDFDFHVVLPAVKTRPVRNIKFRLDQFGGNLRRLQAKKSAREKQPPGAFNG